MQATLAKLIQLQITTIVKQQLSFTLNTPNKKISAVAQQILENLTTAILLSEPQPFFCLSLIYRLLYSCEKLKAVSSQEILLWIQNEPVQDYLLKLITNSLVQLGYSPYDGSEDSNHQGFLEEEFVRQKVMVEGQLQNILILKQLNQQGDLNRLQQKQQLNLNKVISSQQCLHSNKQLHRLPQEQYFQDISVFLQQEQPSVEKSFHQSQSKPLQSNPHLELTNKDLYGEHSKLLPQNSQSTPRLGLDHKQTRKNSFNSLNNDSCQYSEQHIKALKLTDERRVGEQDQVSEVSSFFNQSSFVSCSIYNVQDTSRYGHLLYGDKVDSILRSFSSNTSHFMLVRWKRRRNGELPTESIIQSHKLREHCPQKLIEYYQLKS